MMEELSSYIEYHAWAHEKVLMQLAQLPAEDWRQPLGGSFPTLNALYQHIMEADYRWLQRWKGVPFAEIPKDHVIDGYETLNICWRPLLQEIVQLGKQRLSKDRQENVHFITGKGLHVTQPFWQTLYQVVNHGTYHRGQVTQMLRMLNRQPVTTDIFIFFNEKSIN